MWVWGGVVVEKQWRASKSVYPLLVDTASVGCDIQMSHFCILISSLYINVSLSGFWAKEQHLYTEVRLPRLFWGGTETVEAKNTFLW